MVLSKERAHFVLETMLSVVRALCVDVADEGIEVGGPDGEEAVAALPGEVVDALVFHPNGGRGFQVGDQVCGFARSGNAYCEVNVVGDAAGAKTFAVEFAGYAGEVGVQAWGNFVADGGQAVFSAEDDVHEIEAQRLCHGRPYVSGFQPSCICTPWDLGLQPRLLCDGLSALARLWAWDLGLRPRLLCGRAFGPLTRDLQNRPFGSITEVCR